jgi:hypothetical protein
VPPDPAPTRPAPVLAPLKTPCAGISSAPSPRHHPASAGGTSSPPAAALAKASVRGSVLPPTQTSSPRSFLLDLQNSKADLPWRARRKRALAAPCPRRSLPPAERRRGRRRGSSLPSPLLPSSARRWPQPSEARHRPHPNGARPQGARILGHRDAPGAPQMVPTRTSRSIHPRRAPLAPPGRPPVDRPAPALAAASGGDRLPPGRPPFSGGTLASFPAREKYTHLKQLQWYHLIQCNQNFLWRN